VGLQNQMWQSTTTVTTGWPHLFWSPPSGALLAGRQAMRWHAHHKLVARARKLLCRQVCQCSQHWQSDCHRAIVPQWCHSDQSENSYVPSLLTAQWEVCGRDMKMADPLAESNGQIRDVQNPCKRGVSAELQCKLQNQLWHSLQEKSLVSDLDTNQLRGASDCGRAAERQVLCCAAAIHPVSSRPATPHNHSVTRWITLWITLSRLPFHIFSHLLTSLHWMLKEAAFWLFVQMCCSVENWPRDLCCTRELCHCLPLVVVYKVTGDCKAQTEKLPRLKAGAAPDHKVHCGWGPYFFRLWRKCEKMAGRTWHLVLILFGWGSKMEVCRRSMIRGIQCSRFLLNWTLLFSSSSLSLPPDAPGDCCEQGPARNNSGLLQIAQASRAWYPVFSRKTEGRFWSWYYSQTLHT